MKLPMCRVSIAIATYRRPEMLRTLLDSLREAIAQVPSALVEVIVVDNDPDQSARKVPGLIREIDVSYVAQPKPGISATRNAAIVKSVGDFLVFVDDDEYVDRLWLRELLEVQALTESDAVAGPVFSVLPANTPKYIRESGLFDRAVRPNLSLVSEAATGNLLIRRSIFDELDPDDWFSESFNLSGGEDAEFTRRLHQRGATIVWAAKAAVWETVPASRVNLRWLARRFQRVGAVDYTLSGARRLKRIRGFVSGAARFGSGAASLVLTFTFARKVNDGAFRRMFRGLGFCRAALGIGVLEYRRAVS